jgi:ATP-dependent Clp protease adaptor protein ClpS
MPDSEHYTVLILNDDYTPMEFVVHVLQRFFDMDKVTATSLVLRIHHEGRAECGYYAYELAEKKVAAVLAFAQEHQRPLQCLLQASSTPGNSN